LLQIFTDLYSMMAYLQHVSAYQGSTIPVVFLFMFAVRSLAYKELRYASLAALIADYRSAYAANWHTLERVYIGLPLPHDAACNALLKWKVRSLCT
jgi:Vasohibin